MKMALIVLFGFSSLLFLANPVQADVFIFKNKLQYTFTGGGSTTKSAIGGWTVLDDANEIVQVLAFTSLRKYAIVPEQNVTVSQEDGGRGHEYTSVVVTDQWTDTNGYVHIETGGAKGLNSTMTINGTARSVPKVFTWAGRSVYAVDSSGDMKFEESSGVFTFDPKSTATSNSNADDANSAAQRLANELTQQGYQQL